MAKFKPVPTLTEMERHLGYSLQTQTLGELDDCFYSDLSPVSEVIAERTKKEYDEMMRKRCNRGSDATADDNAIRLGKPETYERCGDTVILTRTSPVGLYSVSVDIHYNFGFSLRLLFSKDEAYRIISVAKLHCSIPRKSTMDFFRLPKEIRDRIYDFALPKGYWSIKDVDHFDRDRFPRGIGDPTGAYFPLGEELGILRVNWQMRTEALPFAYRKTTFHLDDMDDLFKLLIAVGQIGRANIESIQFPWDSRADTEWKWRQRPHAESDQKSLPALHAPRCIQLLQQCRRLRKLCLYFESELMQRITPHIFMTDPSIQGLCSLVGVASVELQDFGEQPLERNHLVKWLARRILKSTEEEELEGGTENI